MLSKYLYSFVLLCYSLVSVAQGSIRGKITDDATGENLVAATVIIKQTGQHTISDLDGNFVIEDVPKGLYDLECNYLGYGTQRIVGARVEDDRVCLAYFKLKEGDAQELGVDVVVTAEAARYAEAAMLAQRKNATQILETLSSEEIQRFGSDNAAQALRLMPSVTIERDQSIYIRGLGSRYVKTLLNGAEMPALNLYSSSVQLDIFPTLLIDNMVIHKNYSSDLIGSFGGGYIDVTTKSFPEKLTIQATIGGGFDTRATFNPNFVSYQGGAFDWVGVDDGTRNYWYDVREGFEMIEGTPNEAESGLLLPTSQEEVAAANTVGQYFDMANPNAWDAYQQTPVPNVNFSFLLSNQSPTKKGTWSYGIVGLYKSSYSFYENGFTGIYNLADIEANTFSLTPRLELEERKSSFSVHTNLLGSIAYKTKRSKIAARVMQNTGTFKTFLEQDGFYYLHQLTEDPQINYFSRAWGFERQILFGAQLEGKHLYKDYASHFEWQLSGSRSIVRQPDLRYGSLGYLQDIDGNFVYFNSNLLGQSPSRYWRDISAYSLDAHVDWVLDRTEKTNTKYKFGLRGTLKWQTFFQDEFRYLDTDFVFMGDLSDYYNNQPLVWDESGDSLVSGGIMMYRVEDNINNNIGVEIVPAMYGLVEKKFGRNWKMEAGLRVEMLARTLVGIDAFTDDLIWGSAVGTIIPQPSVAFRHSFGNDMHTVFAYSTTLARPSLRELSPFTYFDFIGDYQVRGDTALRPTVLQNLDARWEWYLGKTEILSMGIFSKYMRRPIETAAIDVSNTIFEYQNAPWGGLVGFEFEFRKKLDFIGAWAKGFSIVNNIGLIQSLVAIPSDERSAMEGVLTEVPRYRPLFGQSPFVFNNALNYNNEEIGLQANISANFTGRRLAMVMYGGTPNIYEKSRVLLNFNVSKRIGKFLQVRLLVDNILGTPMQWTQTFRGKEYPYRIQPTAQVFWLSFNFIVQ